MAKNESPGSGMLKGAASNQVLTFSLGAENFGVDILRVREIRGWSAVTKIPKTPPHVLGVLNLRGSIVPIIDLRARFRLEQVECTSLTVIIVLAVNTPDGQKQFGLVVDQVSDVIDITPDCLRVMPQMDGRLGNDFIQTLAVVADQMLILLDIDALIAVDATSFTLPDLAGAA